MAQTPQRDHGGDLKRKIAAFTFRTLRWGRDHVPPLVRSVIGILFVIGGIFGFLPILGFWMIPLGLAFIALDIPPAHARIEAWMDRLRITAGPELIIEPHKEAPPHD